MGVVQVELPDDLTRTIDRLVTEGRVASQADYVRDALQAYSDHLDAEDDIFEMVERADADMAAGRFTTVSTPEDSQALHEAAMARLRARLAEDAAGR